MNPKVELRDYQKDVFEFAKTHNTICVLPTGVGKTLIAFELCKYIKKMREEANEQLGVSFFLSPTCNLTSQQSEASSKRLSDIDIVSCTGEQMTYCYDDWRRNFAQKNKFVFMTPQVFLDSLRHAFISLEEIDLLVFDECHNTRSNSPYRMIMMEFYFRLKFDGKNVPHILGLTASPSTSLSRFNDQLMQLQRDLDSYVYTSSRNLSAFSHDANEEVLYYEEGPSVLPEEVVRLFDGIEDPEINISTVSYLYTQLGKWGMDMAVRKVLKKNEPSEIPKPFDFWEKSELLSDKVKKLVQFLLVLPDEVKNDFHGIVFCQRITECELLAELLQKISDLSWIRCTSITGHGEKGNKGMTSKDQMKAVSSFRERKVNLAVATSVVEEGLDVGSCNFVIRFFEPPTLQSHIQSKGRGRAKDARYVLMSSTWKSAGIETVEYNSKMLEIERKRGMFKISNDYEKPEMYECEETGAIATLQSSISLLYRWCSSVHCKIEWLSKLKKGEDGTGFFTNVSCSIGDPLNQTFAYPFPGPERDWMKKTLALRIIKYLHQKHYLDNFLLPPSQNAYHTFFNGRFQPIIWDSKTVSAGSPRDPRVTFIPRIDAPKEMSEPLKADGDLHVVRATVVAESGNENGERIQVSYALLSCKALLSENGSISLSEENSAYERISFEAIKGMGFKLNAGQLELAKKCTEILFRCVSRSNAREKLKFDWDHSNRQMLVLPLVLRAGPQSFSVDDIDWEQCKQMILRDSNNDETVNAIFSCPNPEDMVLYNGRQYYSLKLDPGVTRKSLVPAGEKTFEEYAKETGVELKDDKSPFYKSKVYNRKITRNEDQGKFYTIPRETTTLWPLKYSTQITMVILAENFWHLEHDILVTKLTRVFSEFNPKIRFGSCFNEKIMHKLLVQALTSPSVSKPRYGDYDKLEFLGDAILKYACVMTLIPSNVGASIKSLAAKKSEIVSNSTLYDLCKKTEIPSVLQTEESPWLSAGYPGTYAENIDRRVPNKSISDTIESLTGAVFMAYFPRDGKDELLPLSEQNVKSAWNASMRFLIQCGLPLMPYSDIASWDWQSLGQGELKLTDDEINEMENCLGGIKISNKLLLQAAFTQEVVSALNNYERLEFLGDAVLDAIVTQELYVKYGDDPNVKVGMLSDARSFVVENDTLAYFALERGFDSFIKCSVDAKNDLEKYKANVAKARSRMTDEGLDTKPPRRLFGSAPKFIADVFEACIGLIHIQNRCDITRTSKIILPWISPVLDNVMKYRSMPSVLVRRFIQQNPQRHLGLSISPTPKGFVEGKVLCVTASLTTEGPDHSKEELKSFKAKGWSRESCVENLCDKVLEYLESTFKLCGHSHEEKKLEEKNLEKKLEKKPDKDMKMVMKPDKDEKMVMKPDKDEKTMMKPEKDEKMVMKPEKDEKTMMKPEKDEKMVMKPEKDEKMMMKLEKDQDQVEEELEKMMKKQISPPDPPPPDFFTDSSPDSSPDTPPLPPPRIRRK